MFISKHFILQVYKHLSTMHADPSLQGARQKTSAIKYFLATDMFYKANGRPCDLDHGDEDATVFVNNVGKIVKVNDTEYTRDFYTPLRNSSQDYDVGSNFFSVGVIDRSRNNTGTVFPYPQRGHSPVLEIQNTVLTLKPEHYENFRATYLSSPSIALCLVFWLCRFHDFNDDIDRERVVTACVDYLADDFTTNFIDIINIAINDFSLDDLQALLNCQIDFSATIETITSGDISQLWNIQTVLPDAMTVENDNDIVPSATALRDVRANHGKVFFGAPGTGKSFKLSQDAKRLQKDNIERVTFYPTYTYQQFVGAYKPSVKTDSEGRENITYTYVPGPFLRLLTEAYQNPEEDYLLIIEELNRANAAAVFGDAFQLLDRKQDGTSEYPVALSEDMKQYFLNQEIELDELALPSNFYIWATMNSADQGVFPIDTAFKRRWDFEYLGIDDKEDKISGKKFKFEDGWYEWNTVRKTINNALLARGINEDKQLGPFFLKLETVNGSNEQFLDAFKSKVLMYLFEDAARHCRSNIFNTAISPLSYSNICKTLDEEGLGKVFRFIEEANIVVTNNDGGQDNE